jgi:hypothetical protein
VTSYQPLMNLLTLPEPDDRHVLAAAIVAGADVIVTYNLKDFRSKVSPTTISRRSIRTSSYGHVIDLAPALVVKVVRAQQARLKNPPITIDALLALFDSVWSKPSLNCAG